MADADTSRCVQCGQTLTQPEGRGRRRKYCSYRCSRTAQHKKQPAYTPVDRESETQWCAKCASPFHYHRKRKFCLSCADKTPKGWRSGKKRECESCEAEYTAYSPNSRHCSRTCRDAAWRASLQDSPTHTCAFCGEGFTPKSKERVTYCSRECAYEDRRAAPYSVVHFPECAECGARFTANRPRAYCSEECRQARRSRVSRELAEANYSPAERTCLECGASFTPVYGDKRRCYCSSACLKRNTGRAQRSLERARLKAARVESVNPYTVFERDGWRCQICGKDTPRARRGSRYTNAPELDHRIPLSVGGEHSYANTQCACRACNQEKSNRSEVGQLPLIAA